MSNPLSESEQQHRRDVFRGMILPILIGVGVFVAVVAPVFFLPNANQVGIVADVLTVVFVLFPIFICLFPLYLLLLVLAFGIGRANYPVGRFLRRVNRWTSTANKRVATVATKIEDGVIQARSSVAWIENQLNQTFQPKPTVTEDHDNEDGVSHQ